jgi:hypothetical protein
VQSLRENAGLDVYHDVVYTTSWYTGQRQMAYSALRSCSSGQAATKTTTRSFLP